MAELKYNKVKWTIPILYNGENILYPLDYFVSNYIEEENPFESFSGNLFFLTRPNEEYVDNIMKEIPLKYKSQFYFDEYNIDSRLFYDENFARFLHILEKKNISIVISNDFLFNFIQKDYKNISLVASESKLKNEKGRNNQINEIDFYNDLICRYDRVILDPEYVKTGFMKDYKEFTDVSKVEIYVNYAPLPERKLEEILYKDYYLSPEEIEFLVKEAGIEHLRLCQNNNLSARMFGYLFNYVFKLDAKSILIFSDLMNKNVSQNFLRKA